MSVPAAGAQIHFDVAGTGRLVADLHYRPTKIGPSFAIQKARVQYPQGLPIEGAQLITEQALVLPDRL
jgi:hypothetical protein